MEIVKMLKENRKAFLIAAVIGLVLCAVLSFTVVADFAADPVHHAHTIEQLDEKKDTVLQLSAVSAAGSAAISLLPGDVATPIANKLADVSSMFLVVLCAIYLEKFLLTLTAYAAFKCLIPLALLCVGIYLFTLHRKWLETAARLAGFGILLTLLVPLGVWVSDKIETTYEKTIDLAVTSAAESMEEAQEGAEDIEEGTEEGEEENALVQFFKNLTENIAGLAETVSSSTTSVVQQMNLSLNRMLEALAVMLVTSCLIPLLVLVFLVWIVKLFLGLDVNLSSLQRIPLKKAGE